MMKKKKKSGKFSESYHMNMILMQLNKENVPIMIRAISYIMGDDNEKEKGNSRTDARYWIGLSQ